MSKAKSIVLVFFVLASVQSVVAQSLGVLNNWSKKRIEKRDKRWAEEKVYKQNLFGLAFQTVQNENFSPVQFPGLMLSFESGKIIETEKRINIWDQNFKIGALTLLNASSPTFSSNIRFGFSHLRKLNKNFSVGGQFAALANPRINPSYENNAFGLEAILDLGLRLKYNTQFDFIFGKYGLAYHFAVPVLSLGFFGPGYNTSFTENTKGVYSPLKYQRVQSELFLILPPGRRFPNKNIKFGYKWDYLHQDLNNGLNLFNTTHTLSFIGSITKIK
jgi:hypothetical protein